MTKLLTSILGALGGMTLLSIAVVLPPPPAQDGGSTMAHARPAIAADVEAAV